MTGACLMERLDDRRADRDLATARLGRYADLSPPRGRRRGDPRRATTSCWFCRAAHWPRTSVGWSVRSRRTRPRCVDRARLSEAAAEAKPLAEADKLRTALLRAVGHDLRTPLASAKASVTSLRSTDVDWTDEERDELLATADESLDRLDSAGRQPARPESPAGRRPGRLHAAAGARRGRCPRVLAELGDDARDVTIDIPPTLPLVAGRSGAARAGARRTCWRTPCGTHRPVGRRW